MAPFDRAYEFLIVFYCNYGRILYRFLFFCHFIVLLLFLNEIMEMEIKAI